MDTAFTGRHNLCLVPKCKCSIVLTKIILHVAFICLSLLLKCYFSELVDCFGPPNITIE